ncbi:MAG: hypothetical protein Q4D44_00350 [Eubacteriales bacterium]|nr:hypothetical protein [Eubacteriales bacterium]
MIPVIREKMERFNCCTEDKRYLVFEDRTEEFLADYNKHVTCVRLPDGRIVEENSRPLWGRFIVKDGLVYQKDFGPLHHPKRSKRAKKMKVLPDYPRRKMYKSFEDYLEQECYAVRNEETGKYGEWYNPDGVYDWYSIGGRWPAMFLVKTDCTEYSFGERGLFTDDEYPAPEDYRWVACARKKDIQWDEMRRWRNQKATERFHKLEAMFQAGETEEKYCSITDKGVLSYGELVYRQGQTLEEYLHEYGIPDEWKYPISVHDLFHEEEYRSKSEFEDFDLVNRKLITIEGWRRTVDEFIDDADDDVVFVGIDYHI